MPVPRIAQPEAAGSAITLETSEPLFYLATALNACGYDTGLAESNPVRQRVRGEINDELTASADARDARDALCSFIREHALSDPGRSVAQYISLALYLTPPPEIAPSVDKTELPPDAAPVVDILPLLRPFADAVHLNALWYKHRAEYEAMVTHIHDPLTKTILDTNLFLRLPVSSYDGRRFLVLLEPMLAPEETNARYNGADSVVVVAPRAEPVDAVPMELIRHTYLHFLVEPMVYTRTAAINRLTPLLRPVADAPLEFVYKNDIMALLTECLIKSVEAKTMDVGIARPVRPSAGRERAVEEQYAAEMSEYERQAEIVRRRKVELDMRQGWVLVEYFYNELTRMEKDGGDLKASIGPMIYGMDVDSVRNGIKQIVFLPQGSGGDILRRTPRALSGLELAERKLAQGDLDGAETLGNAALTANLSDPAAHYLLGRIDLMHGNADGALEHLNLTVQLSHDPRTIAWAHIYLGRLYDIAQPPQRDKAIEEYRAALANRDSNPETKAAAEKGIAQPFALPRRTASSSDQEEQLDPTGKAEKEAYKPTDSK
jgi:tetratricopeptide (TPR) repeat protein